MKKSLVLVVLCCLLAVLGATAAVFSPPDAPDAAPPAAKTAALTAADAPALISQGKTALQEKQIRSARDLFAQAVSADPNNQEANLLYGVTRVFAIVEEPGNSDGLDSVREIFEASGFSFQTFGLYGMEGNEPDQIAPTTPRTGAVLDFVKLKVLPEIDGALGNLEKVSSGFSGSTLTPAAITKSYGDNILVDYADALVIKALLNAVKCNLNLLMVYGLDVSIPDIAAAPDQLLTYKKLFTDSAELLKPKDAPSLGKARTGLIDFIDTYTLALSQIQARGANAAHHLFVVNVTVSNEPASADSTDLVELANALAEIKLALNGPKLLSFVQSTLDQDRTVDLSKFFGTASSTTVPIDIRARLGNCTTGAISSDATIGGLFPNGLSDYNNAVQEIKGDLLGVVCTGFERPKIEMSPDYLWFSEGQGSSNGPYAVTIRNVGTAALSPASIGLAGVNSGDFVLNQGNCGSQVAAGSSCGVTVEVKRPVLASGSRSAELRVSKGTELFGAAEITGDLSPSSGASISGFARYQDGQGICGELQLYNATTGELLQSRSTNESGGYAFTGLSAGSYKLHLLPHHDPPSLGSWYNNKSSQSSADLVQLTSSQNISGINFTLLPGMLLTVQTVGTGSGTVTSNPGGISCMSDSSQGCDSEFPQGGQVTLTTTASINSLFAGWSGACSGTGSCVLSMNAQKNVTASFTLKPPTVRIDGNATSFYSIGQALNSVAATGTVRAKAQTFHENVVLYNQNQPVVRFKGGFTDDAFSTLSPTSFTVLDGSLTIQQGTLRAERLLVR